MLKLRIIIIGAATLLAAGCSTMEEGVDSLGAVTNVIPDALNETSLIYRPTIQQGNVVTQEQVNALEPGMTKRQVRFLLGTPMLTGVFHADRWDYTFTEGVGSRPTDVRHVTVFFEDDRLVRISGDLRPQPPEEREEVDREVLVTVPDWVPPRKSLWRRALGTVGMDPYEN
jgi:outer membrane protein assembly factor BamE